VDGDDVRIAAADGLGAYRGDARVTQALIGALPPNRKRPRVLDVILRALGRIGHSSALPALVEHLKDPRGRVAAAVAAALGDLGTPEAASALRNAQERLDRGRPLPGGDGAGRDGDAVMNEARRADHERREVLGTAIRNALSRIGQPAGR
jgi:HEAT repeat protein